MTRNLLASFLVIVVVRGCPVAELNQIDDHFYSDLSSENNRVAAVLYLDEFNENLDSLTYDFYMAYMSKHETPSAKGLARKIQKANEYYFKTKKNALLILLYYKEAGKIVGDISQTAFIDTLIQLNQKDTVPSLRELAGKMRF
jgi:hypothetical protein